MNSWKSKTAIVAVVLLLSFFVVSHVFVDNSSTLSTFSYDGYKDLNRGEEIYITRQKKSLNRGALILPDNWKEKFSVQITFPRIFEKGMRRLTIKAAGGDLVLSSLSTKPMKETYKVKKHNLPYKPKLRPVLP